MAKLSIVAGATSQSVNVFIQDSSSTTGAGLTGLAYNTSNLVAYYTFTGANATATAITLATLAAVNSAYSSGGFKEVDATNMPGIYRLDLPNVAITTGKGRSVVVMLKGATNMAPCVLEIELTGWDNQDAVRGGLTALPNVASGSAGAIITSGTGTAQLNVASGKAPATLASTDVTGNVAADVQTIKTQSVTCSAGVTVSPFVGSTGAAVNGTSANTLSSHDPGATLGTSTLTQAQVTGGAYALNSASFSFNSGLDLTTTQKASVTTAATAATPTVTVGTNNDKTGYALTGAQSISSLSISGALTVSGGATFTNGTGSGLTCSSTGGNGNGLTCLGNGTGAGLQATGGATGHGLAAYSGSGASGDGIHAEASSAAGSDVNLGGNGMIAGNLNGSVTGNLVGNVLGIVVGSVGSVSSSVTVGTNNDKTGYALTSAYDAAKTAAQAGDAMALTAGAVDAVWDEAQSGHATAGTFGKYLDVAVSSRNATAPDNTSITAIKAKTDNLPASPAAVGSAMTLTSGERDSIAAALLDLADGVETGRTPRQALRLMLAALVGKLSGAATATVTIRDTNDSKDRVVATVDADGNRTALTLDAT